MRTLRLADYLNEDLVLWDLPRLDKPSLIKAFATRVASRIPTVNEQDVTDRLLEREAQQSTGIGGGLALPHALVPGLEKPLLAVGRAHEGLDFAALDSEPVDLFFLLLSPPEAQGQHLRLLARLSRILAADDTLTKLRRASGAKDFLELLIQEDARHV